MRNVPKYGTFRIEGLDVLRAPFRVAKPLFWEIGEAAVGGKGK